MRMQFRNVFSIMGALTGRSMHNPVFIIIILVSTAPCSRIGAATTGENHQQAVCEFRHAGLLIA